MYLHVHTVRIEDMPPQNMTVCYQLPTRRSGAEPVGTKYAPARPYFRYLGSLK